MEVIVSLQGLDKAEKRFQRVATRMGDVSHAWPAITESIAKSNQRSWGRGVKLAESTVEKKQQADRTEPLVWSGRMKASLTQVEAPNAIRQYTPYSMTFGTSLFYARFQQHGTKEMPKHRVLKMTTTTRRLVQTLLMEHILSSR